MSARSRWVWVTVATVLGMALTAALGRWQLHRAAEKEALQAAIESRAQEPVLDARGIVSSTDAALLHRRVEARGQWLPERTVYLDNRQMNAHPGFFVMTPLRLEDGTVVLVQRGWVPRNFEDRTQVPSVITPAGWVMVQGLLSPPPSQLYDPGPGETGLIRQNLDLTRFRLETGLPLADLSLQQIGPASEGLLREWPPVNLGIERHYGYAFQWFGFCTLMAILYVWFQIVPRVRGRKS